MKDFPLAVLFAAVFFSGCGQKGRVLGQVPRGAPSTILAINAGDAHGQVSLAGTMIEKCPQAGCWFRIQDETGVIKVDTKNAGFVVTSVPLNAKVTLAGKVVLDGSVAEVQATGLQY